MKTTFQLLWAIFKKQVSHSCYTRERPTQKFVGFWVTLQVPSIMETFLFNWCVKTNLNVTAKIQQNVKFLKLSIY